MAMKKAVKKSNFPLDSEDKRKFAVYQGKAKIAEKKSKQAKKTQRNMDAIRAGGQVQNRSRYYEGIDEKGGYSALQVGNQYFGENKKKTKRPAVKKK